MFFDPHGRKNSKSNMFSLRFIVVPTLFIFIILIFFIVSRFSKNMQDPEVLSANLLERHLTISEQIATSIAESEFHIENGDHKKAKEVLIKALLNCPHHRGDKEVRLRVKATPKIDQ